MKRKLWVLTLGLWSLAIGGNQATATVPAANGGSYSRIDGRWWYRTAEGQRYVYTCSQWVRIPAESSDAGTQQAATPPVAITRRNPGIIITYPNDGPPDVSHGIDWYRNGRGSFSD